MNAAKNRALGTASETSDTEAEAAVSGPGLAAMIQVTPAITPARRIGACVRRTERCDLRARPSVMPRRYRQMKDTTVARAFPKRDLWNRPW